MGFNKRFLNKNNLIAHYKNGGIDDVLSYVTNPEVLYIEDKFSSICVEIISNKNFSLNEKKLQLESFFQSNN